MRSTTEVRTQRWIRVILCLFRLLRKKVIALHVGLPEPRDAEDMGDGRIPESLAFSLRGDLECLLADHLEPAIAILDGAAQARQEGLDRAWGIRMRQQGEERTGKEGT
jgi:hypothetical protein